MTLCELCHHFCDIVWIMSSFLWHCVDYVIISMTLCGLCHNFYDIVWIMSLFLWHCVNYVIISVTLCELCHHFYDIVWIMSYFLWHSASYVIISMVLCEMCHFCDIVYNYLCNQCLSPLTMWVQTPLRRGVLDTALCDKVCQWLVEGRWFSLLSSTSKTDCHDISEILIKVVLNTINKTYYGESFMLSFLLNINFNVVYLYCIMLCCMPSTHFGVKLYIIN